MLVHMRDDASPIEIEKVRSALAAAGCAVDQVDRTVVVLSGKAEIEATRLMPGVARVEPLGTPYKLVHRSVRPQGTHIRVGDVEIGGREFVVAAGPCAIESESQMKTAGRAVAKAGARILRGGAFKPRTSPYSFQGLEKAGLEILRRTGRELGMPVVTEVLTAEDVPLVAAASDILQIGARNMQNYRLLAAAGAQQKPVLLKRGPSGTLEELLLAAEYIALQGNLDIILCERGIRTFEPATRNTLDLGAAVLLSRLTHLPVFIDPSHGTGRRELVGPLSKAAAAVGAAGLLIEVHPDPDRALSDGAQSVTPDAFARIMRELSLVLLSEDRHIAAVGSRAISAPERVEFERARIDAMEILLRRLVKERADARRRLQALDTANRPDSLRKGHTAHVVV